MAFHEQVRFGDTAIVGQRELDGIVERASAVAETELPKNCSARTVRISGLCYVVLLVGSERGFCLALQRFSASQWSCVALCRNSFHARGHFRRSFLKERGSQDQPLCGFGLFCELSCPGWARRSRRRGQGSGGARPRSGRRALTAAPLGACCSGQGGRNCLSCFRLG